MRVHLSALARQLGQTHLVAENLLCDWDEVLVMRQIDYLRLGPKRCKRFKTGARAVVVETHKQIIRDKRQQIQDSARKVPSLNQNAVCTVTAENRRR